VATPEPAIAICQSCSTTDPKRWGEPGTEGQRADHDAERQAATAAIPASQHFHPDGIDGGQGDSEPDARSDREARALIGEEAEGGQ